MTTAGVRYQRHGPDRGTSYKTDLVTDGMVAFLWENGTMRDLAPGLWPSWAYAIDDAGHVVGAFSPNDIYIRHAFLWQNGVTTEPGYVRRPIQLGVRRQSGRSSRRVEHKRFGRASRVPLGERDDDDLGTLGGTSSYATAINNAVKSSGGARTRRA